MANLTLPDLIETGGPQRSLIHRAALLTLSLACFVLGVICWLIPVLSGIPFYVASIAFLGMSNRRVGRWINYHEARVPHRYRVRTRRLLRRPLAHLPS